ncbi:FGGY-family carbohydrate kinase [Propionivibrio dicarboxylicus]|uniref:Glycerol kinase n=1 Tax=Propionivibrio dicarboxylicus TaxID=83767 RepID=A0A1G8JV93_9RHOO|nr:FGGY-family carbohydrate kinase [Propionivibrio dicarboxylicus]SDI34520.1 glycerol kinase [Propionivibrio dicarboxylicus]
MKGIVTVDVGTTSMRAILYDGGGRIVHIYQRDNAPEYFDDGRVEQAPQAWAGILADSLAACAVAARDDGIAVAGIAVTAQRSSVIPVDADGVPLHPAIMWQDRRTAELARAMQDNDALVYGKTGLKISPVFSALKMLWFRRERPELWQRTHKMIGIQDWVLYLLSGRYVTDHTFGSRTNLFDLKARQWDDALLDLFSVERRMLCDLVAPGAIVGGLTPAMASATGLPAGLPVVSAGGDQQCAALGLGLFSPHRAVSNTGTGSYMIGHADHPVFDEAMRLACNASAVPGAYIVEAAVLTSGAIYRWCRDAFYGDASFDALNAEAAAAPAGANGLLLLPHFKGSGAPYWDPQARGAFYNLTLSTTRGEMARAILEGIAVEMKGGLSLVERLCGCVDSVSVSGGLARSDLFNQIQSDVFDRPVERFANNEATSLGAWIAGAVAVGLESSYPAAFARAARPEASRQYRPDASQRALYERQCRRSEALYQALASPVLRELFE